MVVLLVLLVIAACHISASHAHHEVKAKTVAVVGAGAGGSSAAYYIKEYATEAGINVSITVLEKSSYIGGRSTTVNAWDAPDFSVELGASIFVEVNKILVSAARKFNLSTTVALSAPPEGDEPMLGIWNGEEFILKQKAENGWWDIAKLLWRYGLAPIRTNNLMKTVVGKFLKMYDEPYFPWSSLSAVAYDLGLTAVTAATGEQYLRENNIGTAFANEVIQASTRVNYAQNLPLIHGLETMVCMATNGAMSVVRGNWQIFDQMIRSATADVRVNTSVIGFERQHDGTISLQFRDTSLEALLSSEVTKTEHFDTVVLAAPYQFSGIRISPAPKKIPDEIPYVQLHVTLFASPHRLSPTAFNLKPDDIVPHIVLTTLRPDEHPGNDPRGVGGVGFFSISMLRSVKNPSSTPPGRQEYLYKIFSPEAVNSTFLTNVLGLDRPFFAERSLSVDDVSWIYRKVWHSYPYEYPRVTFEDLRLDENLWYTSAIENFISTMETSALAGMNVAKLIVDGWLGESSKLGKEQFLGTTGNVKHEGMQKPLKADL